MSNLNDISFQLLDGKVETRVWSAGTGSPVIYLHGANGFSWDPFLEELSQHHRIFAPEHPGSTNPDALKHFDDLWDLVLYYDELLDILAISSPVIMGHSFGAMVAAEIAATFPRRVGKLVLIAPTGLWLDDYPQPDFTLTAQDRLFSLTFADPNGPVASEMLAQMMPQSPEELGQVMLKMNMALASACHFLWPIPDKGLKKRLRRINCPSLLLWGAKDGLVPPAYGQAFKKAMRMAKLEVIEGAGHLPQLEQRARVVDMVRAFIAS